MTTLWGTCENVALECYPRMKQNGKYNWPGEEKLTNKSFRHM